MDSLSRYPWWHPRRGAETTRDVVLGAGLIGVLIVVFKLGTGTPWGYALANAITLGAIAGLRLRYELRHPRARTPPPPDPGLTPPQRPD